MARYSKSFFGPSSPEYVLPSRVSGTKRSEKHSEERKDELKVKPARADKPLLTVSHRKLPPDFALSAHLWEQFYCLSAH